MHQDAIRTGKLSDQKIISLFNDIEKGFGLEQSNASMYGVHLDFKANGHADILSVQKSYAITSVTIVTKNQKFTVQYHRGIMRQGTREASPYFDEITIKTANGNNIPNIQDVLKCTEIINSNIIYVMPSNAEDQASSAIDLLQAQMSSLSELYQNMLHGIDKRRAELDKSYASKEEKLDSHYKEKIFVAENQEKDIRDKLDAEGALLVQRMKELDDRDHRHVRRDLRTNINEDIKSRLEKTLVPKQALFLRMIIFYLTFLCAIALGYLAYKGFIQFSLMADSFRKEVGFDNVTAHSSGSIMSDSLLWTLLIRSMLASIGALAFFAYSIKWLRKLHDDDIRTQRELERYTYDINRASWAIETIMDVKKDGTLPPQTWISAVCSNLFFKEDQDNSKKESSPLALLLSSSARAEFGPDGTKFEIGRDGAKKLAKQIEND